MGWKPGQSGNPTGNARQDYRTRRMLDGLGVAAVKRLGELIASDNQPVALGACREVLARVAPVPKANILALNTNAPAEHMAALLALAGRVVDRAPSLAAQPPIIDGTEDGTNAYPSNNPLELLVSEADGVSAKPVKAKRGAAA